MDPITTSMVVILISVAVILTIATIGLLVTS